MNSNLISKSTLKRKISRAIKSFYFGSTTERPYPSFFYRKKSFSDQSKVYDCFYFFNELDLLEIRLNILNDYVDYFVIIESTVTFTGKKKRLVFQENIDRFEKFKSKIIYHSVNWSPTTLEQVENLLLSEKFGDESRIIATRTLCTRNIPRDAPNSRWVTEYFQKESLMIPLKDLHDNDIVYVSDLDEIWNPKRQIFPPRDKIFVFKQKAFIYFLNNQSDEFWHQWTGTIACRFSMLKKYGINESRTHNRLVRYVIRDGGWHFSFQGGPSKVLEKLETYPHLEYSTEEIQSKINNLIDKRIHLKGTDIRFRINNQDLPDFIKENRAKYSHFLI